MFKFASSSALSNTTNYYVCAKTSNSSSVTLFRDGTAANWSHLLRTTATGTAAAGDPLYVMGDWTAGSPDTLASYTISVTTNDTNSYGQVAAAQCTAASTPTSCCTGAAAGVTCPAEGIQVSKGGTLNYTSGGSTTSAFKAHGQLAVFSSGEFDIGKCAARDYSGGCTTFIPSTSTTTYTMDSSTTNVDSGLSIYSGGIFNAFGSNSPSIVKDLLAADAANGATTITTTQTTGWLNGDSIVISSTSQTPGDAEVKALTGNCTTTSCPITALATANTTSMCNTAGSFDHCGITPTQADLGRITHNVLMAGTDSSHQGYVYCQGGSQCVLRYVETKWFGSATTNKRGFDVQTTTCGTTPCFDMQYSSLHDDTVANSLAIDISGAATNNVTISNNVFWNNTNFPFIISATTGAALTFDSNLFVGTAGANQSGVTLFDVGGTFTNNIITSGSGTTSAITVSEAGAVVGTFAGNTVHSNSAGLLVSGAINSTLSTTTAWRNSATGLVCGATNVVTPSNITFAGLTMFGNSGQNIIVTNCSNALFTGVVSNGDAKFATTSGVVVASTSSADIVLDSPSFDVAAGSGNNARTAHTNDMNYSSGYGQVTLNNPTLSAANPVGAQTSMAPGSYFAFQRFNTTAGDHRYYTRDGLLQTDTTNYYNTVPGLRLTPNSNTSSTERLQSGNLQGEKCVNMANGTKVTPTVHVCLISSPAYNGLAPRLLRKKNQAMYGSGDTADELLATGTTSTGTCVGTGGTGWQTLSAQTASNTTDDGVVCFFVDVTGTTGYAVVDDWSTN